MVALVPALAASASALADRKVFDTDCFKAALPKGYAQVDREKPDPWRPWVGRWELARGKERITVRCERPERTEPFAKTFEARAGELRDRIAGLALEKPRFQRDEEGREVAAAIGRGHSGGAVVLVALFVGLDVKANLVTEVALVVPADKRASFPKLVEVVGETFKVIDAVHKERMKTQVRGTK